MFPHIQHFIQHNPVLNMGEHEQKNDDKEIIDNKNWLTRLFGHTGKRPAMHTTTEIE
jgi:hypothetical protein